VEVIRVKVSEVPLPTKPREAIGQAVDLFDSHLANSSRPLEIEDPHHTWQKVTHEGARGEIGAWLDNLFRNTRRMDACRSVSGITVVVFRGLAGSSARTMALKADEHTRLGDGYPSYAYGSWKMTQKKGEHMNTARLKIRQKK